MGLTMQHPRRKHKRTKKQKVVDGDSGNFCGEENGINDLHDELLVAILSYMGPDEAARTSVLSRRWRYLWYFSFECLDFDPKDTTHETAIRKKKFIRFIKDQLHWRRIRNTASLYLLHSSSRQTVFNSLERHCQDLQEKEVEVELFRSRLKKYEKKKWKMSNSEKRERYARVCDDIEEKIAEKKADIQKEQERIQTERARLEVYNEEAEKYEPKLFNMLGEFSAEKWIVLNEAEDVSVLIMLSYACEVKEREFYFTVGGIVDLETLDIMREIAQRMGIEDLNPSRLYLLKNREFTTVSLEKQLNWASAHSQEEHAKLIMAIIWASS